MMNDDGVLVGVGVHKSDHLGCLCVFRHIVSSSYFGERD